MELCHELKVHLFVPDALRLFVRMKIVGSEVFQISMWILTLMLLHEAVTVLSLLGEN